VTVMALTGLQEKTESLASEHHVPGVAVGIFCDGEEHHAYHGITSAENPLAVGPSTLSQVGSITKAYTATAIMALAEAGKVGLDDPVRAYVPELHSRTRRPRGRSPSCSSSTIRPAGTGTTSKTPGTARTPSRSTSRRWRSWSRPAAGRRRFVQQRGLRAGRPPDREGDRPGL
jgi:Beta-lactamase